MIILLDVYHAAHSSIQLSPTKLSASHLQTLQYTSVMADMKNLGVADRLSGILNDLHELQVPLSAKYRYDRIKLCERDTLASNDTIMKEGQKPEPKLLERTWPVFVLVPLLVVFLVVSWRKCLERRRHRVDRDGGSEIAEVKTVMQ